MRSITTVGGWTMCSRLLGFVRDILIARYLGTGLVADAFFVAFKFPNFFRRLFAEGAFNSAFVPQFARILEAEGREPARAFAARTLSVLISVLLPFMLLVQAGMPYLMVVVAPGFVSDPEKFALTVELTRLTFPYLLFMALVALLGGVLNSLERFRAAAAAPILLNIMLISALLLLRDAFSTIGHALAWGVTISGAAQLVMLMFATRATGMVLRLPRPRLTPQVRKVLRLMLPGVIGAGVVQVNLVIDVILASTLSMGSISYLYYADRVTQLPLGVVGVAVGIVLLPLLSRQLRAGNKAAAHDSQNRAIELSMLLSVPAAMALIAISEPIVIVLFQRGAFNQASSVATAQALTAFATGLPAYVLIKALSPGFFAREDTATPVKIAVAAVLCNVAAALVLMQFIAHVGIALATALTAWGNAGALAFLLHRRGFLVPDLRLKRRLPRIVLAAALMAVAIWAVSWWLAAPLVGSFMIKVSVLAVLVVGGMMLFVVLALVTGAANLGELRRMFMQR